MWCLGLAISQFYFLAVVRGGGRKGEEEGRKGGAPLVVAGVCGGGDRCRSHGCLCLSPVAARRWDHGGVGLLGIRC